MNEYIKNYESYQRVIDNGLQRYMVKVYGYLALSLLLTLGGAMATLVYMPLTRLLFRFDMFGNIIGFTAWGGVMVFAPFIIAMYVSRNVIKISFTSSRFLLGLYAVLTGCSLASLVFYYTADSLHKTFLITVVAFVVMSLYGCTTSRDLTSVGSFCVMALWGLLISALVNLCFNSELVNFVSSFVGVIAFVAFIAYNTQNLKRLYYEVQDTVLAEKVALMGAFSLYLNFLNLFTYLLHFLGERKKSD